MKIKKQKEKMIEFFEENQNKISWSFFLAGFLIDNFTLIRIDSLTTNLILLSYLFLAIFSIFIINFGDYRGFKNKILFKIYTIAPFVIQFAFGALFSGYVIFYTRSTSFLNAWPFLIILYLLFVVNEKLQKQYEKFHIQISIFYFAFLSFLIFYTPILMKKMNNYVFIFSWIISLIFIILILKFFYKKIPSLKKFRWKIFFNLFLILIFFNFSYFSHLLPPVPLSVKKIGIYHYAGKDNDGDYILASEKEDWFDFKDNFNNLIHWKPGNKIYAFASVFAPDGFRTDVYFVWYWFNNETKRWEKESIFRQHLIGGKNSGFKTRSLIRKKVKAGLWKVEIVSNEGSILDEKKFEIKKVDYDYPLKWERFR